MGICGGRCGCCGGPTQINQRVGNTEIRLLSRASTKQHCEIQCQALEFSDETHMTL